MGVGVIHMKRFKNIRYYAVLIVLTVTALSITGIFGETLAIPLILLSLSLLFFTLAYESVSRQDLPKAKRFLTLGLFLLFLAFALGVYAWTQ